MEMFLFARLLQSPWRVDGEAFVELRIEDEPAQRGKRVTEEILIIPWNSILINFLVVQQTSALDRQSRLERKVFLASKQMEKLIIFKSDKILL